MGFNYAKEKRLFEAEWKKLNAEYSEAGFDAAGINAMREFDWKLFCQRRTYENSEQAYPSETIDNSDDGNRSTLFRKFPLLTVNFDENSLMGRYSWIEAIADPILADKLAKLSDDDKELLTGLVFDRYTQMEIATMRGCSQVAICKKIKRIKIFLE